MTTSRRRLLALAGTAAVAGLTGCSAPTASSPSGRETMTCTPSAASLPPSPSGDDRDTLASQQEIVDRFSGEQPRYWGLDAPEAISRFEPTTEAGRDAVVLTLDACGGPVTDYDAELIASLRRHHIPATLFINRDWSEQNPETMHELVADPLFEIANHGTRHVPLSVTGRSAYGIRGTADITEVWSEIAECHLHIAEAHDYRTAFMRAGTAHTDDVSARIAHAMDQAHIGFTVNADGGASLPPEEVRDRLASSHPGDIVIAHMNRPTSGTGPGFAQAVPEMVDRGVVFRRLGDVL